MAPLCREPWILSSPVQLLAAYAVVEVLRAERVFDQQIVVDGHDAGHVRTQELLQELLRPNDASQSPHATVVDRERRGTAKNSTKERIREPTGYVPHGAFSASSRQRQAPRDELLGDPLWVFYAPPTPLVFHKLKA